MPRIVDGATRLLPILGDPIRQVRSPEVLSALFRANGVNAVCVPVHVLPPDLPAAVAGLRVVRNAMGFIATIPHKQAVIPLLDGLTPRSRRVGSANVVRREADGSLTGDIVDGVGFVKGLTRNGQQIAGRRALVVGSGGVGSAIAFAVAEAGATSVHVADILAARAVDLSRRLEAAGTPSGVSPAVAEGFDLIVNASPLGMKAEDPIPIDCAGLSATAIVCDVVVHPQITPLLAAARKRGCHVQPGTVMMDYQLEAMREFFPFPEGDYSPEAIARVIAA
ncbi:MAG TPA: shikimate dehydrogenase [Stellaceae bacterium]|nr:shikimate dehydrogenase [Stellaceae bacterium]